MKCKQFNKFVANIDTLTSDQRKILNRVMVSPSKDWRDTLSKDMPVLCYVGDTIESLVSEFGFGSVDDRRWVYKYDSSDYFQYISFVNGEKSGNSVHWRYALPVDQSIWTDKDWELYYSI